MSKDLDHCPRCGSKEVRYMVPFLVALKPDGGKLVPVEAPENRVLAENMSEGAKWFVCLDCDHDSLADNDLEEKVEKAIAF